MTERVNYQFALFLFSKIFDVYKNMHCRSLPLMNTHLEQLKLGMSVYVHIKKQDFFVFIESILNIIRILFMLAHIQTANLKITPQLDVNRPVISDTWSVPNPNTNEYPFVLTRQTNK